ncbi:hypothetical protein REPUB_Repub03eG0264900 [Reevesia pubescens]
MASKVMASTSLVLFLNLLFFALVSSYNVDNNSKGSSRNKNPVVILRGATFPNGNGNQGQSRGTCNPLNLGVCANLLGGLVNVEIGHVPCCSLIQGLADLEAAVCLCTAIRANVLGINLNLPISLSLLLNDCGRYKLSYYRFGDMMTEYGKPSGYDRTRGVEIGNKDIKLEHLEEAFTTSNWIVRIYKVKPPNNRW